MRSKMRGILFAGLLAVMFAGAAVTVATFSGLGTFLVSCDDKVVQEFASPNNDRVAMVIVRNCGATTSYSTSVGIKNPGEPFDFDRDNFFAVKGLNRIEVVWKDNYSPTVIFDRSDQTYRQAIVWRGERISYRQR